MNSRDVVKILSSRELEQLAEILYAKGKEVNDANGLGDYVLPWGALADDDYARYEFRNIALAAMMYFRERARVAGETTGTEGNNG